MALLCFHCFACVARTFEIVLLFPYYYLCLLGGSVRAVHKYQWGVSDLDQVTVDETIT